MTIAIAQMKSTQTIGISPASDGSTAADTTWARNSGPGWTAGVPVTFPTSGIILTGASNNTTFASLATGARTLTFPDASGTVGLLGTPQTWSAIQTFVAPVLGVATATSINKVAITAPASGATLTIADGATLTASGTATVSGTNTGDQTNISGNAATVTTNANLTGPITSTGNTTSVASQTGTGSKFVMDTAPTIVGGAHTAITNFAIRSSGASFDLSLATSEILTAGRTLSIVMGDSARALTFTGNASISGTNTGDQTNISGNAATVTTNANLTGDVTSVGNATTLVLSNPHTWSSTQTFVTPVLGAATATTINKVTITAPATGSTLTISDGVTLTASTTGTVALLSGNSFTASQTMTIADATTNAVTTGLTLQHNCTTLASTAANFGTGINFNIGDTTTTNQAAAAINVVWTTATHSTHASQILLQTSAGGAAPTTGLFVGSGISGATAALTIGSLSASAGGIWGPGIGTLSNVNYALLSGASLTELNAPSGGTVALGINGSTPFSLTSTTFAMPKITTYAAIATAGLGVPAVYGLDKRSGLVAADGSATTLYTATAANQLYRLTADIFATATVAGTASYTITWTENSTTQTLVVTSTTVNNNGSAITLARPDNGTAITAQLTFSSASGAFSVVGIVEELA